MKVFEIDKNALDEEWTLQPKLHYEAAEESANTRADYERAKAEKELVEAELDKEVRTNPSRFGLEKLTEPAIKNAIIMHLRYKEIVKKVIDKMHDKDNAEAVVFTLEHRKKSLENLVQLRLADYFSEPKKPKGHEEDYARLERDSAFPSSKKGR